MVISIPTGKNLPENKAITIKSQSSIFSYAILKLSLSLATGRVLTNTKKWSMSYCEKIIIYRELKMTGKEP